MQLTLAGNLPHLLKLLRLRSQFAKQDVVLLGELGYVPASKGCAELLFDLIGQAYERQRLVVIT